MLWDDVETFIAVVEAGSLSAVARRRQCTQPAIGQRIRRLEKEVGVALLERRRSGVSPTSAGSTLYGAAVEAMGSLATGLEAIRRARGEHRPLRIAAGETTVRRLMVAPLAGLLTDHPELEVNLMGVVTAATAIEDLQAGRIDMAFLAFTELAPPGLERHPLLRTRWSLVTGVDDPLGSAEPLHLADLNTSRLIGNTRQALGSSINRMMDSAFAAEGVILEPHTTIVGWDTQLMLVEAGLGHAVVPTLWTRGIDARVAERPLPHIPALTFGWLTRRWTSLPKPALDYANRLHDHLARLAVGAGVQVFPPVPS